MTPLLDYFWPPAALGLLLGALAGIAWFRRDRRIFAAAAGALALGMTALWHGPLGAADRFTNEVEKISRFVLVDWEMGQVRSHLFRHPLTRRLSLSGQADDFQRTELVRMMSTVPGVSRATWTRSAGIPLVVEAMLVCAAGFLIGLLLAYVVEIRRRYNAQWKW